QKVINSMQWSFMYRAKYPSASAGDFTTKCNQKFKVIEKFMSQGSLFHDRIIQEMDELENLLDGRDPKSGQKTAAGFEFVKYLQTASEELQLAELERDKVLNPLAQKVVESLAAKNSKQFQSDLNAL